VIGMPLARSAFAASLLLVAVVVQVAVLAPLRLPGATPDLVLVVVVALALVHGSMAGSIIGFLAGLTLDLAPPADHAVGQEAFVLCLVGYLAGLVRSDERRSALVPMIVVAASAAGAVLLYAVIGVVLGDPRISVGRVLLTLPPTVTYALVLAPFVVPTVGAVARRLERRAVAW
jgi:rod shape-determining protein MreD